MNGASKPNSIQVTPGKVSGRVVAPPSKSQAIRAIAAALLSPGESHVEIPSLCDDVKAAMRCAEALGATIQGDNSRIRVHAPKRLKLRADSGRELDCGESALCLRIFTCIAALCGEELTLKARGTLSERATPMLSEQLAHFGINVKNEGGYPPFQISGTLSAAKATIDASQTSQLLSGLLFTLPLAAGDSEINVTNLTSRPYLELTLEILNHFGISIISSADLSHFKIPGKQSYKTQTFKVEGDWSGAAPLLVAGALSGPVEIVSLNSDSKQADRTVINVLEQIGAEITLQPNSVTVKRGNLRPFKFDATDCPDIVPAICALALSLEGESIIKGADRLKNKESDRAKVLVEEFSKLGAALIYEGDTLRIKPSQLKADIVHSHHDHRIAMALGIAALGVAALNASDSVTIEDAKCVSKSYPNFFRDLERIKVKL